MGNGMRNHFKPSEVSGFAFVEDPAKATVDHLAGFAQEKEGHKYVNLVGPIVRNNLDGEKAIRLATKQLPGVIAEVDQLHMEDAANEWERFVVDTRERKAAAEESMMRGINAKWLLDEFPLHVAVRMPRHTNPDFTEMNEFVAYGDRALGKRKKCPRDGKDDCSIVDAVYQDRGSGAADLFVSWVWKYRLNDALSAVAHYVPRFIETKNTSQRTFGVDSINIWWCFFVNNQFRIQSSERVGSEELEHIFGKCLQKVGHMLVMLDQCQSPQYFKRIWCIYEVFRCTKDDIAIDMTYPVKTYSALMKECDSLTQMRELLKVNVQDAKATFKADEDAIKNKIKSSGGFDQVNETVQKALCSQITKAIEDCLRPPSRSVNYENSDELKIEPRSQIWISSKVKASEKFQARHGPAVEKDAVFILGRIWSHGFVLLLPPGDGNEGAVVLAHADMLLFQIVDSPQKLRLKSMANKMLQREAAYLGIDNNKIKLCAADEDKPKEKLVELIMQHETDAEKYRKGLENTAQNELAKKAMEMNISGLDVLEANTKDNANLVLTDLIMARLVERNAVAMATSMTEDELKNEMGELGMKSQEVLDEPVVVNSDEPCVEIARLLMMRKKAIEVITKEGFSEQDAKTSLDAMGGSLEQALNSLQASAPGELQAKLEKMTLRNLKARMCELGISEETIAAVDDEDNPKEKAIEMISMKEASNRLSALPAVAADLASHEEAKRAVIAQAAILEKWAMTRLAEGQKNAKSASRVPAPATPAVPLPAAPEANEYDILIERDRSGKAGFTYEETTLIINRILDGRTDLDKMKKGDKIIAVDGKRVHTGDAYWAKAKDLQTFQLTMRREA